VPAVAIGASNLAARSLVDGKVDKPTVMIDQHGAVGTGTHGAFVPVP
jgi:hypothetical protein